MTFIITEGGRIQAERGHHDDLVMSLALAVTAYKNLIDTSPIDFVSRIDKMEAPAMPSKHYKPKLKTSFGAMSEEDYRWIMK